jgi:putative ABC transport system permease protein
VGRFVRSQLLHRPSRPIALGVGILVAALTFTLLTSAVTTSALEIRGTVQQNFRSAYDILVRPTDSYTPLERDEGLVRANYLSGIFGGITLDQWHSILNIPGVEVAAPIEMIGYILPFQRQPIELNRYLTREPNQIYRIHQTRIANGGLSHYRDADQYVYYTRNHRFVDQAGNPGEVVPGQSKPVPVCNGYGSGGPGIIPSPFDPRVQSDAYCFSERSPKVAQTEYGAPFGRVVGANAFEYYPILLAAIDPIQENKLLDLDGALVAGRSLGPEERPSLVRAPDGSPWRVRQVPVLMSTRTYVDETLRATVERLRIPPGTDLQEKLASASAQGFLTRLPGRVVGVQQITAQATYDRMLNQSRIGLPTFESYRTVSAVSYRVLGNDFLSPTPVQNAYAVWKSVLTPNYLTPPKENEDVQFRKLTAHVGDTSIVGGIPGGIIDSPDLRAVGRFDPAKLPGFSQVSGVPLETYNPPAAQPANPQSDRALHGRPLLPTMNLGDYLQQPPLMLTTLNSARLFFDPQYFSGVKEGAPVSVIRVRVARVTGPDPLSLAKIKQVALTIQQRTGLAVDITAGSSPHPILIDLPGGNFGRPPLLLREGWAKKGVAVVILQALDRKSLALFLLVLVVTSLFLVNGALASVRARRTEIGTLLALGWTRRKVYEAVLGELLVVGLVAAAIGLAIAAGLVLAFDLDLSVAQTLLVVPIAIVLAVLAGVIPALLASRGHPLDAVRPAVAEPDRPRPVTGIVSMSLVNTRRVPIRTVLAAAGLFVGVGALTVLLSIGLAFKGTLVGTALGRVITLQIRPADYVAVAMVIVLGAASSADVLFLNIRERAAEFVTLSASGWGRMQLGELVTLEGLSIGLLGSVLGAATGLVVALVIAGSSSSLLVAAGLAAIGGSLLALLASLVPASLISRLAPPGVLAEE